MPDGLRQFAEVNPFSTTTDAIRALWLGAPAGNDVWAAFAWAIGITLAFGWLSVRKYRRAVTH
jgi:ABC-type polysaccharide/polyol phosphate export permease